MNHMNRLFQGSVVYIGHRNTTHAPFESTLDYQATVVSDAITVCQDFSVT